MDTIVVGTAVVSGFGFAFAVQRLALGFLLKAMEASINGYLATGGKPELG